MRPGPHDHVEQPPYRVTFLRHGESVSNRLRGGFCFESDKEREQFRALTGGSLADQDTPLTSLGERQSDEAGVRLFQIIGVPTAVYCSPHFRARQTLERVAGAWPHASSLLMVVYDVRVRERESSPVSMMIREEVDAHFPWLQRYHDQVGAFYFRYPSGESLADVVETRARPFMRGLHRRVAGDNVLVVTHVNFMRCCRFVLEGWDPERLRPVGADPVSNCGILVYESAFDGMVRSMRLVGSY